MSILTLPLYVYRCVCTRNDASVFFGRPSQRISQEEHKKEFKKMHSSRLMCPSFAFMLLLVCADPDGFGNF